MYIALSFTRLEGESKAHIWQSISLSYTIFKCCLISLQVAFFLSKFKQPNMKIQFKKLVWVKLDGAHECYTTPFRFMIWEENQGLFLMDAHSHKGLERRVFCQTLDEAKDYAQSFLEITLTQFIETSENPAQ